MSIKRLCILWACVTSAIAAKVPKVHETSFAHLPRKFTYFDDSSVILFLDEQSGTVHQSDDDGVTWSLVKDIPDHAAQNLVFHPFDKKTAFVLGNDKEHYRTSNRGKSWQSFKTDDPPSVLQDSLSFNANDHDHILYAGERCDDKGSGFWGTRCRDITYYTEDMFQNKPKLLRENTHSCIFARSTKVFKESSKNLVICIDDDIEAKQKFPMNLRLVSSKDWFESVTEISSDNGPLRGVVGVGAVQTFLVAATKNIGTDEMAMYVSDDGLIWDLAEFPSDGGVLKEDAYTVLESRPYSIQVDVMSTSMQRNSFGALFTSNSNGTYFTKNLDYTNRNEMGIVDFENVENVDGIVLANVVANYEEVQKQRNVAKKLQSRISFNDGREWQPLKPPEDSDCDVDDPESCSLHLYSAAAPHNVGRIFSSTTPGLLMGVGSVGSSLLPYSDCDLFVSDDAGVSWRLSKQDAHKYEWGDQGSILMAVFDEDTTNLAYYSFDRGQTWDSLDLGMKVRARILTTTPDSTTEKFVLVASRGKGDDTSANAHVFAIDFTGIRSRQCTLDKKNDAKSDFEKWYARYDAEGSSACLMGHKQYFWRKKAEKECYVGDSYNEPEPKEEDCPCRDEDFECDYNFIKDGDKCVLAGTSGTPKECIEGKKTYSGPSGYRLIPGNTCDRKTGLSKDAEVERDCDSNGADEPSTGKIIAKSTDFDGHARQYFYLERTEGSSGADETVIMQIDANNVFKSHDHGKRWQQVLEDEDIAAIIPHRYFKDWVYFLTPGKRAFLSKDRGKSIHPIELPTAPNNLHKSVLDFHSTHSNWLLFAGMKGCDSKSSEECRAVTYYTEDGGLSWDILLDYTDNCQYIGTTKVDADANLIFCASWTADTYQSGDLTLYSSINYFENHEQVFQNIVGFAVFEEFIVVAEVHDDSYLQMYASIDGFTFAHGHFPPKFDVTQQQAYTVLDSLTKSIFLHVTTNSQPGREWGSILKSNSNGTYFVTSLDLVNRNTAGYVDFEKLMGLEGVAIVNVVSNENDALSGSRKKLRTKMTHNDGGEWNYLTPPSRDSEGNAFSCKGSLEKCSLHLHGYTERVDVRDTYSSGSAVGILLGVGNVGEHLVNYEDSNTFLSNDGGISWQESHKGPYQWEFGDQGSIVVIVKDGEPTDRVLYSLDEGRTWVEHVFAGDKMYIRDITTLPSDNSRNFLLFAKPDSEEDDMKTINIDFSGLTDRKCAVPDADTTSESDFYLWTPSHPSNEDKCLFGHVSEYLRKKTESQCYVGAKLQTEQRIVQNCTCTIYDYECDYNYQRANDGTCQLIPGLAPPDHSLVCAEDDRISWTEPTGYRRIPLTTCQGGKTFDQGRIHACPGHERELGDARKGLHGFWLFIIICLPFLIGGGTGYYVWSTSSARALGQIRLGDDSLEQNLHTTKDKIEEFAVLVISGVITVLAAIPTIARFLWHTVQARIDRSRFRSGYYEPLHSDGLLDDPLDEDI